MATNTYLRTALFQLNTSSLKFADQLRDVLRTREFDEQVASLQTIADLMEVIDFLDKVPSHYQLHLSSSELVVGIR